MRDNVQLPFEGLRSDMFFNTGTVLASLCTVAFTFQTYFNTNMQTDHQESWRVELPSTWDILGPFPIHAREQHFLSPAFPLNLSESIDYSKSWPSSYADGGNVNWSILETDNATNIQISFPHIRWKALRATEGWAALQHHAVIHGILTLYPPLNRDQAILPPCLLAQFKHVSYFTILPFKDRTSNSTFAPEWHSGNIYGLERAIPRTVRLPTRPSDTSPTKYEIFISGDYEIRLFGDPHSRGSEVPIQSISLEVNVESPMPLLVHESSQDVVCDFIDGYAFGDAIGIGVRSISGRWKVKDVFLKHESETILAIKLLQTITVAPSQTRIIPIRILKQEEPYNAGGLEVNIIIVSDTLSCTLSISLPLNQRNSSSASTRQTFMASYFFAQSMPTAFLAVPPIIRETDRAYPPILALHGAGVDIIGNSFWTESLPRNNYSWIVIPTGRTSWGLDWHGSSSKDAWASVEALSSVLANPRPWQFPAVVPHTPVVIIGHSNGGQGAWYMASRHPDRIIGVIAAAGYIKSQAYVPLTMSRAAHFMDPTLRGILETSLTPDDNDLHLSNLVHTPVLAIHGGEDDNVPVWHSREAFSIIKTWLPNAEVVLQEDAHQGHWYPTVLNNTQVDRFLDSVLNFNSLLQSSRHGSFTLTSSVPGEDGSLHGFKIEQLSVPGRIGRLMVENLSTDTVRISTSNIQYFSLNWEKFHHLYLHIFHIDDTRISVHRSQDIIYFERKDAKQWKVTYEPVDSQLSGRVQSILSSEGPIVFVVSGGIASQEMSLALRLAHDLLVHHRLDSEIRHGQNDLSDSMKLGPNGGNIVVIGSTTSSIVQSILRDGLVPIRSLGLGSTQRPNGKAIVMLHPHPINSEGNMLLILFDDLASLERAGRLFPTRTGVTVPDWVVVGQSSDILGAGGVEGAGVWGKNWSWNEHSSWLK